MTNGPLVYAKGRKISAIDLDLGCDEDKSEIAIFRANDDKIP